MATQLLLHGVWSRHTDITLLGENPDDAKEFDHTLLYRFVGGQWTLQKLLEWSAAGAATDVNYNVVVVGGDGEFAVEEQGEFVEGRIPGMPTVVGLSRLPSGLFAVALSGRIYRYQGEMEWALDSEGIEADADLYSICGNADTAYVAGSWGRCYAREPEGAWVQQALPTDRHLKGFAIDDAGNVIMAGWGGTLISGKAGDWTLVEHKYPHDDFYCVRYHEGVFYVAGKHTIYRVTIGESVGVEPILTWELTEKGLFSDMFGAREGKLVVLSQDGIFVKQGDSDWRIVR